MQSKEIWSSESDGSEHVSPGEQERCYQLHSSDTCWTETEAQGGRPGMALSSRSSDQTTEVQGTLLTLAGVPVFVLVCCH